MWINLLKHYSANRCYYSKYWKLSSRSFKLPFVVSLVTVDQFVQEILCRQGWSLKYWIEAQGLSLKVLNSRSGSSSRSIPLNTFLSLLLRWMFIVISEKMDQLIQELLCRKGHSLKAVDWRPPWEKLAWCWNSKQLSIGSDPVAWGKQNTYRISCGKNWNPPQEKITCLKKTTSLLTKRR